MRFTIGALLLITLSWLAAPASAEERPFGTLREQAAMQQGWLKKRLDTFLPGAHAQARHRHVGRADARVQRGPGLPRDSSGRDAFAARRRTIYVFFDRCAATGRAARGGRVRRADRARRLVAGRASTRPAARRSPPPAGRRRRPSCGATSSGRCSKPVVEERSPGSSASTARRVFAFSDGLSSGELAGHERRRSARRGRRGSATPRACRSSSSRCGSRRRRPFFRRMQELVWSLTQEMFSSRAITPGKTHHRATSCGGGGSG